MISGISGWIISIAAVVIIGVILDLIMPDGELNKYIRSIISLVIVLVIVLPLPKLINGDFNLKKHLSTDIEIDENLLFAVNKEKVEYAEKSLQELLKNAGFENVKVSISADYNSLEIKINAIFVDLSKLVLKDSSLNINKYQTITDLIVKNANVEEGDVLIYG